MKFIRFIAVFLSVAACDLPASCLSADSIYMTNIKTVRVYRLGNQLSMPVINLNTSEGLELHFDDLDADVKNYYYTYVLCDFNWQPVNLGPFDYIKGFTQSRLSNSRFSAIANTRYTHYQAILPDRGSYPIKAGNYILKVYLDGDTSKVAFTKRIFVADNRVVIGAKITQPFAPEFFRTHQKVQFQVDVKGLNDFNAAQNLKVVVLQNYRWDNAMTTLKPAFIRGNSVEYNSENSGIFPGGKEWRWLDIRDFKLQSDRVESADYRKTATDIYLKPDGSREGQRYVYYRDLNGLSTIEAIRGINPFWEADYATVYFSFLPPNRSELSGKDLYLYGQLTDYNLTDSIKMVFNKDKGLYETHLLMKQGYYDYTYVTTNTNGNNISADFEGDNFETENNYTILVYYKPFGGRNDELVGVATLNSRTDRPGISF